MLLNSQLNAEEINLPGGVTQFAVAAAEAVVTASGGGSRMRRGTATQEVVASLTSVATRLRWGVGSQEIAFTAGGLAQLGRYLSADADIISSLSGAAFAVRGGAASNEIVFQLSGTYESVRPSGTAELVCNVNLEPTRRRWGTATATQLQHDASGQAVVCRNASADTSAVCDAYGVGKLNDRVNGYASTALTFDLAADQAGALRRNGQATAVVTGDGQSSPTIGRRGIAFAELVCAIELTLTTGKRGSATAELVHDASGIARKKNGGRATASVASELTELCVCRRGAVASAIFIATGAASESYRTRYAIARADLTASGSALAGVGRRGLATAELIATGEATSVLNLMSNAPVHRRVWVPLRNREFMLVRPERCIYLEP